MYIWGVFDKIEHLFVCCDYIIAPKFQKSRGFYKKNRTIVLIGAKMTHHPKNLFANMLKN